MGLPNPSVFSLYWDQFCDEDDDSTLADPFAADPGDLPIASSGCSGDGAIDSIAEYMMGGTFGGVTYPSKMAEDWDVVSIFAGYDTDFASGCGSKPGELFSTCLHHHSRNQYQRNESMNWEQRRGLKYSEMKHISLYLNYE